jgi:hypothetical protein
MNRIIVHFLNSKKMTITTTQDRFFKEVISKIATIIILACI